MAGLIKKKLLKELAKFAKNLQPEQIELNTLKGEGELRDLALDETLLTSFLEFPLWLKMTKCTCNKITAKIHWTHLGSKPIWLSLDRLEVYVTTCEDDVERVKRNTNSKSGKYGLSDRVIDGLHITVNSILAHFSSPGHVATFDISNLDVASVTPTWTIPNRLDKTRIIDESDETVTTFKKITWQTLRLEFSSDKATDLESKTSPLRLITNQGSVHVTIRKRLSDCVVTCGRLEFILDDYLLWVLTHSQVREAVLFVESLFNIIDRVETAAKSSETPLSPSVKNQGKSSANSPSVSRAKRKETTTKDPSVSQPEWSVLETSYHICLANVSLQLYDDSRRGRASDEKCGSMQCTLSDFFASFHPRHPFREPRSDGARGFVRNRHMEERKEWATAILRNQQQLQDGQQVGPVHERFSWSALEERCFIFGCSNVACQFFPSSASKAAREPFLISKKHLFPDNPPTFLFNFTSYRYAEDVPYKVPSSNLFLSVCPIQFIFDPHTCLWTIEFVKMIADTISAMDLSKSPPSPRRKRAKRSADVYFSILLPTVILPIVEGEGLELEGAKLTISNCSSDNRSRAVFSDFLLKSETLKDRDLFRKDSFPNESTDLHPLPLIQEEDDVKSAWICAIDQLWGSFVSPRTTTESQFLASVPLTSWIIFPKKSDDNRVADIHVAIEVGSTALIRINHDELIATFRLRDTLIQFLSDFSDILSSGDETTENAKRPLKVSAVGTLEDLFLLLTFPSRSEGRDTLSPPIRTNSAASGSIVSDLDVVSRSKPVPMTCEERRLNDSGFITTSHESASKIEPIIPLPPPSESSSSLSISASISFDENPAPPPPENDDFDIVTDEEILSHPNPTSLLTEFTSLDVALRTTTGVTSVAETDSKKSPLPSEKSSSIGPGSTAAEWPTVEIGLFNGLFHFQLNDTGVAFKLTTNGCSVDETLLTAKEANDLERKKKNLIKEKQRIDTIDDEKIALRFTSEKNQNSEARITASNLKIALKLATVLALKDFANDDLIPLGESLPIHLSMENIEIALTNAESDAELEVKYKEAGLEFVSKPQKILVEGLRLFREKDGVLRLSQRVVESMGGQGKESASQTTEDWTPIAEKRRGNSRSISSQTDDNSLRELERQKELLEESLEHVSRENFSLQKAVENGQMGKALLLDTIRDLEGENSQMKSELARLQALVVPKGKESS